MKPRIQTTAQLTHALARLEAAEKKADWYDAMHSPGHDVAQFYP